MRLLAVFTTLLAVSASCPFVKTWTLYELSYVLDTDKGDPSMQLYYVNAFNVLMHAVYTGNNKEAIANLLSPNGNREWTEPELMNAFIDPEEKGVLRPYIAKSLNQLITNKEMKSVEVDVPALDISTWSVADIKQNLKDVNTNPVLVPFLLQAEEEIKQTEKAGQPKVTLVTPVGLVPLENGYVPRIVPKKTN